MGKIKKNKKYLQSAFEAYNTILVCSNDPEGPFETMLEFEQFYTILLDTLNDKQGDI